MVWKLKRNKHRIEAYILHNEVVFNQGLISCQDEKTTQFLLTHLQEDGTCWWVVPSGKVKPPALIYIKGLFSILFDIYGSFPGFDRDLADIAAVHSLDIRKNLAACCPSFEGGICA